MIKAHFFHWHVLFALILCSCSIETNPTAQGSPSPSIETVPPTFSASLLPVTNVPITWEDLNLSGKLIYLSSSMENNILVASIRLLDLTTGTIASVYSAPPGAWIYYVTVSPDAKQLIMSYQPPPQPNSASNRILYVMPLGENLQPQPLFAPPGPHDHYVQAEWSPDGKHVYYAHYNDNDKPDAQLNPPYDIFQISYPEGEPKKIADHAFWPTISSDSTKLVYIVLDPDSGLNELVIANADGSDPQQIAFFGPWIPDIIDAPIFSPDGQSILFSAPGPSQSYRPSWLDKMIGVQLAKAHSVPSDWWSVPITGGVPTRLTNIQTINLFASLLPDKKHIASVSGEGLFVMGMDGSNLTQIISDSGVHGTVSWIP